MPTPQDFMERVVAWPGPNEPGYVNLHWKSPKSPGMRGRPYKTVEDFMQMTQWLTLKPSVASDIYFCLSTQSQTGKVIHGQATAQRIIHNALWLKSIWIDVDVKPEKGYASLGDALDAISKFIQDALLPPPSALVLSGGGVHVYWISDKPLSRGEWAPYAEGLKAEVLRLGLKCDAGLTTDAARVLRVPGTFNRKTTPPRPVKLAHLGASYDFAATFSKLAAIKPLTPLTAAVTTKVQPAFDMTAFQGWRPPQALMVLDPQDSLAEGVNLHSDLPLNPDEVFKGCPHFYDAATTHGAKHGQGLWMLTVLASTFMDDGRRWAHYFSKGYPTYTPEETDAMFDRKTKEKAERGLGWPSCSAIEGEGCKLCKGCAYYGKLRSPLNLAERAMPPQIAVQTAPPPPAELNLPAGFTVDTETGWIGEIVQKQLSNGVSVEELAPLFMCKLRDFYAQGGERAIRFQTSLDMDNWTDVAITEEDLATEQQTIKMLRRQGVKPYYPNQRRIIHFMTSFMAKLDAEKLRLTTVPFGWLWKDDKPEGFVYGGRAIHRDGLVTPAGYADGKIERFYRPVGSIEPWRELMRIITEQHYPDIQAIVATSFGAPLMFVTGQYNGMFCAWSNGSGAHKTTSVAAGAAVWGNPQMTKENTMSSVKGLMRKLGEIRNLPIYWDEIGDEKKMEAVQTFLTIATEGKGGTLLHQDRSFRDVEEWQTMVTIGANVSLWDHILRTVKNTDAQLQRVFEFEVLKRGDTARSSDVDRLRDSLSRNYGHPGMMYSDILGRQPDQIDKFAKDILNDFEREVSARSEERFRIAMASMTFAGAALANAHVGAGFDLPQMWDFLKQEFFKQRDRINSSTTVGGSKENTLAIMTQFFKSVIENIFWSKDMPIKQRGAPKAVTRIAGPSLQNPKAVQVHCIIEDRVIHISKQRLLDYVAFIKHSPSAIEQGLLKHFDMQTVDRVNLAAGSGLAGSRETVFEIPVPPGSDFEDLLFTHTPLSERPQPGAPTPDAETGIAGSDAITAAINTAAADLALVRGTTGGAA